MKSKSMWMGAALALGSMVGCAPAMQAEGPVAMPEVVTPSPRVAVTLPEEAAVEVAGRSPGDYVVFRYSGAHLDAPVEVTERVVERDGDILVIDLTVGAGDTYRLRVDDAPASRGRLRSVARRQGEAFDVIPTEAFVAAVAGLEPLVDDEGLIDDGTAPVALGDAQVTADKLVRRVRVDGEVAFMTTLHTPSFPWGPAATKIRTASGTVVHQVEVVDTGRGAPSVASSELYEGLD